MPTLLTQLDLEEPIQQARVVPCTYRKGEPAGFAVLHSNCAEDDPYHKMFFVPTDTMRLCMFDAAGKLLWRKDLGDGVVPGVWFTTMLVFDLNGDGVDEVYLSINETEHALDYEADILAEFDPASGEIVARRPWPLPVQRADTLSHFYRNLAVGANLHGQRRLIIARGTYSPQRLVCLDEKLEPVWERIIDDGSRGAHTFVSLDLDGDGADELLWGDICLDLATGQTRWKAPAWRFDGHTDIVSPGQFLPGGGWQVYYCREGWSGEGSGGVLLLDGATGEKIWAEHALGHVDMGWAARLGDDGTHRFYGLEIGAKKAGKSGFERGGLVEHGFDLQGRPWRPEVPMAYTLPVDWDGDGRHELVYYAGERTGQVVRPDGTVLAQLDAKPIWAAKVKDAPGEHVCCSLGEGRILVYGEQTAQDGAALKDRVMMSEYRRWVQQFGMGYSLYLLGGL